MLLGYLRSWVSPRTHGLQPLIFSLLSAGLCPLAQVSSKSGFLFLPRKPPVKSLVEPFLVNCVFRDSHFRIEALKVLTNVEINISLVRLSQGNRVLLQPLIKSRILGYQYLAFVLVDQIRGL